MTIKAGSQNLGLLRLNNALLAGIVAYHFGLFGSSGALFWATWLSRCMVLRLDSAVCQ